MDRIKDSLRNNRFVFWEEIARDGAQAKTILSAKQRAEIAKMQSKIFGQYAPDHLVFAAGFISISKQEVEIIEYLADNVDECYLAVNSRSVESEIKDSYNAIKKAKYPRVAFVLPASERLCEIMLHKTPKEVIKYGKEISKFALDYCKDVPVDIQLAAAYDGKPEFIAELANEIFELGIATIGLGDTRGRIYPLEIANFYDILLKKSNKNILYAPHLHNDLDFALQNTFEGMKRGINFASTSWLGLAERNGLARTEVLTFLLNFEKEKIKERLGFDGSNLFLNDLDLKLLYPIAKRVSEFTGISLKVTDPIVGTGINTISTGTPFVDTQSFQPFDPEEVLGVEKKVFVTQLANKRIIIETANRFDIKIKEESFNNLLNELKHIAYSKNKSLFSDEEIIEIFEKHSNKE